MLFYTVASLQHHVQSLKNSNEVAFAALRSEITAVQSLKNSNEVAFAALRSEITAVQSLKNSNEVAFAALRSEITARSSYDATITALLVHSGLRHSTGSSSSPTAIRAEISTFSKEELLAEVTRRGLR